MSLSALPIREALPGESSAHRLFVSYTGSRSKNAIILIGSTTSLIMIVAGIALMQLTIVLAGAFCLGHTLMSAYLAHNYTVQAARPMSPAFRSPQQEAVIEGIKEELAQQKGELHNLQSALADVLEKIRDLTNPRPVACYSGPPPLLTAALSGSSASLQQLQYVDQTADSEPTRTPGGPSEAPSPFTSALAMDRASFQPGAVVEASQKPLDQSGVGDFQVAPNSPENTSPPAVEKPQASGSGWSLGGLFGINSSPDKKN